MKKIINGKRYDTKTAVRIGHYDNIGEGADSQSDFCWWAANLYRTPRSGQYFLAGEGGPMSRFSRPAGQNALSGGEGLTPLSDADAMAWAEQYLDAEVVEAEFADVIEDA